MSRGPHAGEDVPKFVDVDDVNSSSRFRAKRWMVVISYLAAAIITLCISIGASSFVRSAQNLKQILMDKEAADNGEETRDGSGSK